MEPLGDISIFLLLCTTCLFFLSAWQKTPGKEKLPPGPPPLPLLGNLLQLNMKNFPKSVEKLSQKYGPVFTIYLGSKRAVVLYGHEVVQEALVARGDEFSARGSTPILDKTANGTGIGFSNGETWKQLRQFAIATLHKLEQGQWSIEERIQDEANFLLERLRSTQGRPFDPTLFLSHTSCNIICSVAFGSRFDVEDKNFLRFIHLLEENAQLQLCTMTQLYNMFPRLLDHFPGSHRKIFENTDELKSFILERAKRHQKTLEKSSQPQAFIDAFLIQMEQEKQNSPSAFDFPGLVRSTLDLFVGGSESTSLILKYGLLILMKHPEIEEKIHQEIDRVIGQARRPCMADLEQMPYTGAVVQEMHRFIALVPLNLPHAVTQDTPFREYIIPKGTTIFPALKSSLYHSKEFSNPQQFDPGHFLDANGAPRKTDFFIPFSVGRRACIGERLTCMSIFLVLVAILQHFALKPHVTPEELDLSPETGFLTVAPKPFQLHVEPRWQV